MKLKEGRWYADKDGVVRGPMVKLPKDDSRRGAGMRFACGVMTWGKDGHFEIIGVPSSFDLIREVTASSECRVVDARHPAGVAPASPVEPPTADPETDPGLMARILDAAQLTPTGQIGALPYSTEFTLPTPDPQESEFDWPFEVPYRTVGQTPATPADPMAELCQSIVTDAANAAQAIRDKAVMEPAIYDARVAPPLVPKAIKRKKWGDWIKGPYMGGRDGGMVQNEFKMGRSIRRHRIKKPRE